MSKSNFLLVDLNDTKTKKLAETITSETSRKILNRLAEKEETEANLAQGLNLPISTVHYHLQKLQEAGLVKVEEFHYSEKGREVNHYKLANKYIIIAPQKVSGLREKLKGILPITLIFAGISAVWGIMNLFAGKFAMTTKAQEAAPLLTSVADKAAEMTPVGCPMCNDLVPPCYQTFSPLGYFLIGGVSVILIYIIYQEIRSKI